MGNLFRSEEMELLQMIIQTEAAKATVEALGDVGLCQFTDLNPTVNAYQRTYVEELKRCDNMERILNYIQVQAEKEDIPLKPKTAVNGHASVTTALLRGKRGGYGSIQTTPKRAGEDGDEMQPLQSDFDDLELHLVEVGRSLAQLTANMERLQQDLSTVVELRALLQGVQYLLDDGVGGGRGGGDSDRVGLLSQGGGGGGGVIGSIAGLIEAVKMPPLQRILWRATRGNLILRQSAESVQVLDGAGRTVDKAIFVVYFQGQRVESKVTKLADAYGASIYQLPDAGAERTAMLADVERRVFEFGSTIAATRVHLHRLLRDMAGTLLDWKETVRREKATYGELNKFKSDVSASTMVAEAWAPVWAREQIGEALRHGVALSGAPVQSIFHEKPTRAVKPTFFRTNKYTKGFQTIIDAYGMADYQEANPGVFLMVTFPFLFGVMFGDVGHGAIVALFAGLLILKEKQIQRMGYPEIFGTVFNGRYLIFVMGLFAIYCGFLYNDCFSLSIDMFGTNYLMPTGDVGSAVTKDPNRAYPFGLDPGWAGATNKLMFYNSIKMKMAILLGVLQMLFGIVLSCTNHLHFRDYTSIFCEFIPQVLFLMSMFGYMVFLIILKWVGNLNDPPLILGVMIDMFLKAGSLPAKDSMFNGQEIVQTVLLFTLFICPPWMLIPKPLILWLKRRGSHHRVPALHGIESDEEEAVLAGAAGHDDDHGMAEIVVHQVIHTIEFVLGTISNTASYLRLWALSLAHAELSEVIWDQLFFRMLHSGNPALIFGGFAAWAAATTGILLIMESLSAFLHALRLHWVEAAGKHYKGMGIKFVPHTNSAEAQ